MSADTKTMTATRREIEGVVEGAYDAVTDEMVGRLAGTAAETLDLVDQVSRTGLGKAIPMLAQMVNNGDLARLVHLARVLGSGEDALTDEMVGRLAGTAAETLDLVDQISRTSVSKAIPMLAKMVDNGDLQRLMHLARVVGAAEDALTDEMVGRLTDAVGGGLDLIDKVNRSGIEKALPTIARMVADGDLERVVQLARVYGSAQDALTDEMVGRLAETVGEGMSLLDRLNRGGAVRLVEMLERLESSGALERVATQLPQLVDRLEMLGGMFQCIEESAAKVAKQPPSSGFTGAWSLMTDGRNQQTLRFMMEFGQRMQEHCLKR